MAKEKQLKDVDKLIEIGKLITRQETEFSKLKVSQVSAKAKATYNAAVSFIQQNEPEGMKDASNKQIHILGAIEELLVELRKSEMLDDMDAAIKKISKLASKAADVEGSQEAKKFIQSLSKNIISNAEMSKGQRVKSAIAGSLGAADLSIKSILDVKPLMDPSMWKPDSVIGILTTLLDTKKNKDKRKERRSIEDEIESKQKSLDPFHGKKTKKIKDSPKVSQKTTTSVKEPAQAESSKIEPKVGEQFQDFRGVKYEKWATGWRNVDTGKIETRQNQEIINKRYQERMKTFGGKSESQQRVERSDEKQRSKQTFQFPDKISRLTIDRLVINKMVLPDAENGEKAKTEATTEETTTMPDVDVPGTGKGGLIKKAKTAGKSILGKAMTTPYLLGGATMLAGGAALDATLGKFGVGKDESGNDITIDEERDEANWKKMSTFQKIQSGAARGIEKLGKVAFLGNMANEARSKRIAKESEYLGTSEEQGGKTTDIENAKQATLDAPSGEPTKDQWVAEYESQLKKGKTKNIAKALTDKKFGLFGTGRSAETLQGGNAYEIPTNVKPAESAVNQVAANVKETTKRIEQAESEKQTAPVIVNAPVTKNESKEPPIVIPIKGSTRANESSFNRFQDRNFVR